MLGPTVEVLATVVEVLATDAEVLTAGVEVLAVGVDEGPASLSFSKASTCGKKLAGGCQGYMARIRVALVPIMCCRFVNDHK